MLWVVGMAVSADQISVPEAGLCDPFHWHQPSKSLLLVWRFPLSCFGFGLNLGGGVKTNLPASLLTIKTTTKIIPV